ncbi:MAG: YbaK/EbsC family protein [Bacteroidetes bacterium]|nr:YbaK/EbsC family protein [Bacteroidota bacterium]
MAIDLKSSAQRVQKALYAKGVDCIVKKFSASTKTAQEAATAIGCELDQIAKSIVFKSGISGDAILVITSGSIRVNEKKISKFVEEPVEKADAKFVRKKTGFAIGGVPPVGHVEKSIIIIDETLRNFDTIWAAAGTPNSVFRLTFDQLKKITGGMVKSVA